MTSESAIKSTLSRYASRRTALSRRYGKSKAKALNNAADTQVEECSAHEEKVRHICDMGHGKGIAQEALNATGLSSNIHNTMYGFIWFTCEMDAWLRLRSLRSQND